MPNKMSSQQKLIAGDWGTSNLRLYLCEINANDADIKLVEERVGPGVASCSGNFEQVLFNLCRDWIEQNPTIEILLSGMIGSNIGWKEVPYINCPLSSADIATSLNKFKMRGTSVAILSGLQCLNPLHLPDLMRGEELQLLGHLENVRGNAVKTLFCLPGTHNKWALYQAGKIMSFLTSFTGELYGLLKNQSILIQPKDSSKEDYFDDAAFKEGVSLSHKVSQSNLLHTMFSTRSKQIEGSLAKSNSLSYLSGLIIGNDIKGAIDAFDDFESIVIIGEKKLSMNYRSAFGCFGINAEIVDPTATAIAGYGRIYKNLSQ